MTSRKNIKLSHSEPWGISELEGAQAQPSLMTVEKARPRSEKSHQGSANARLVGLTALYIPWGCLYLLTLFDTHRLRHMVGQRTLENFQEWKERKWNGKLNWCLFGVILWLIWTTGRRFKTQPDPSHCPWDSCHILWLPSVWTPSSIWGAANLETQSMFPHSTSWRCPWLASPPPLLLRVRLHATEQLSQTWHWELMSAEAVTLAVGVLCRLVLLQSVGPWSWSNIPEPSFQSSLRGSYKYPGAFNKSLSCPNHPESICCLQSKIHADLALRGLFVQGHLQLK